MGMTSVLTPLIALVAGVLILLRPQLLNYVLALFLIAFGVLGLVPLLDGGPHGP